MFLHMLTVFFSKEVPVRGFIVIGQPGIDKEPNILISLILLLI